MKKLIYIIEELGLRWKSIKLLFLLFIATGLEVLSVGIVLPFLYLLFNARTPAAMNFGGGLMSRVMHFFAGDFQSQHAVIIGLFILVTVFFLKTVFLSYLAFEQAHITYLTETRLANKLFEKFLKMPYIEFIQSNTGTMLNIMTTEIAHFTNNAVFVGISLMAEILVMSGLVVLLLYIEPSGSLVAIVSIILISAGFRFFTGKRVSRWGQERQKTDIQKMALAQQSLQGIKELIVFNKEEFALNLFRKYDHKSAGTWKKEKTLRAMPKIWLEFMAIGGLVVYSIFMVRTGVDNITLMSKLGVFAAAAFRFLPSMNRILGAFQSIRFGIPSIDTIYNELIKYKSLSLKDKPSIGYAPDAPSSDDLIRLQNISFSYPTAKSPCLLDINFTIRDGECIGIIGTSGAGKSTLLDIIVGLLSPSKGHVFAGGKDISNSQYLEAWRAKIGYVSQHVYLFDDSVRNNVAFGVPSESQDESLIVSSLNKSQLGSFISGLPHGIDEVIGERGMRMSGGQRQRIGIARALYRKPALLILDEGTNALDTMTERELIESIRSIKGHCTIILVAHRLTTLDMCDRIVKVEDGKLLESGIPKKDLKPEEVL